MRPDEHKKKRSVQYNNKKKADKADKSNQPGGKAPSHGNNKIGETTSSTTSRPAGVASGGSNFAASIISEDEENSKSRHAAKKWPAEKPISCFKRRTIVSNWERYEVTEDDSTASIQCESADFSKLLYLTGGSTSHFRFRAEQDWETEPSGIDGTSCTNTAGSALSLDCARLASALDCLPLYQRLALPPETFPEEQRKELEEIATKNRTAYGQKNQQNELILSSGEVIQNVAHNDDTSILNDGDKEIERSVGSGTSLGTPLHLDLNLLVTRWDTENSELHDGKLGRSRTVASGTSDRQELCAEVDNSQEKGDPFRNENSALDLAREECFVREKSCEVPPVLGSVSQEEELDLLLSLDTPQKYATSQQSTQQQPDVHVAVEEIRVEPFTGSENTAPSHTEKNNDHCSTGMTVEKMKACINELKVQGYEGLEELVKPYGIGVRQTAAQGTGGKGAENLEDWLDSMLED